MGETLREPFPDQPLSVARPERLLSNLISAVGATPLDAEPFCHVYLRQCFPDDFYRQMLENFPRNADYSPFNIKAYRRANGESTRGIFRLTKENLMKLPHATRALWADVVQALTAPAFRRAIFSKLAPDLADRFGISRSAVAEMTCENRAVLMRDTEDYRINPHPDGLNKYVTMLFYLPEDDSQPDLGTSIYRRKSGFRGLLPGRFEEVKRAPFLRNSALAFAVSDSRQRKSWHGRERLANFAGERNTLVLTFVNEAADEYGL